MALSRTKRLRKHRSFRKKQRKNWCYVYELSSDGVVFYIGQTRQLPCERLAWHVKSIDRAISGGKNLTKAQSMVRDLYESGNPPEIRVIDVEGIWDISEAVWIDRYLRDGAELLNVNSVVK